MILLCVTALSLHAQENSDSTACIPVRTVDPDKLAFAPGEEASFILHYQWGAINSDVGHATVRLDTVSFNGQKAFRCTMYGKTTRLYDVFFRVREVFKSWFTYDGLRPLKFYRHSEEGDYEAINTYVYDRSMPDPHIVADLYSSKRGQRNMDIIRNRKNISIRRKRYLEKYVLCIINLRKSTAKLARNPYYNKQDKK